MVYWIFDLDYTLYSLSNNIPFDYKYLQPEPELRMLLDMLPGKKGIFTNGTRQHAYNSVMNMELQKVFDFIDGRDSLNGLKPDPNVFVEFMRKNKISLNDKILFFEDTLSNLQFAKKIGWVTVFINSDTNTRVFPRPPGVDFVFSDIKQALHFFNNHMNS